MRKFSKKQPLNVLKAEKKATENMKQKTKLKSLNSTKHKFINNKFWFM